MKEMTTTGLFLLTIYMVDYTIGKPDIGDPIVTTDSGRILPKQEIFSPNNLNLEEYVFAYLGIPYAEPPLGERRFRPPEPVQPWEDILNATVNPPACPQIRMPGSEFSEDCLYLSVFVPSRAPEGGAAVMVFLHGGGFNAGSGNGLPVEPLAAVGNVIVVTLNYRLNILGFFTTGDGGIPANLGLLDQRLALQWVYQNIRAFGGDPEKITLFGSSAGAVSVGYHFLSEDSRRFFQRAILQSGVPLNPWAEALSKEQVNQTKGLIGDLSGCGNSSVAACLKNKTVEELLSIVETIEISGPLVLLFVPSIDGEFLASDIPSLLRTGSYRDIDILLGSNRDEGTSFTYLMLGAPAERPFINRDLFASIANTTDNILLTGLLEAIYTDGIDSSDNYEGALSLILGDVSFTCGVNDFARQVSEGGSKVYKYLLSHQPTTSIYGPDGADWLGATHGEELPLVFGQPFFEDGVLLDAKMSFYVIQMWANFAKTGDPNTPYRLPRGISEWRQFNPETQIHKELDINFSDGRKLRQHYCYFWDILVPQIKYLQAAVSPNDGYGR